jgi:DNA-binding NarL/FixJ family response regulator
MNRQRVLLVDDHALFRQGVASLLAHQDDFVVVGEAEDAESALSKAETLQPDLILMDIDLPKDDGVEATRRVKAALPQTSVVMLTVHDDADRLLEAIKAGADGYLVKNIRAPELLEQLRGLAVGEAAVSRRMAARIMQEFLREGESADVEARLTPRELEILQLVSARMSNSDIAQRLTISEHTVKNHLKNILAKLHVRSRHQAAAFGMARGWLRPDRT